MPEQREEIGRARLEDPWSGILRKRRATSIRIGRCAAGRWLLKNFRRIKTRTTPRQRRSSRFGASALALAVSAHPSLGNYGIIYGF